MKALLRYLDRRSSIDAFTATLLTIATPLIAFASGIAIHQRDFSIGFTHLALSILYLALAMLHWTVLAYRQGRQDATLQDAEESPTATAEA